jgi:hypothetical protein
MGESLKQLKQDVLDSKRVLEEKKVMLAGFPGRENKLMTELADKRFELENQKREWANLVNEVTMGDAVEDAVFKKTEQIKQVESEIQDLETLLSGFPKARETQQREVRILEEKVQTATRIFWEGVLPGEKKKLFTPETQKVLLRLWAVHVLSGGPLGFGPWLDLHFRGYDSAVFQCAKTELEAEYNMSGRG